LISMSHINVIDSSWNETPPDDEPVNSQGDTLINDEVVKGNSPED